MRRFWPLLVFLSVALLAPAQSGADGSSQTPAPLPSYEELLGRISDLLNELEQTASDSAASSERSAALLEKAQAILKEVLPRLERSETLTSELSSSLKLSVESSNSLLRSLDRASIELWITRALAVAALGYAALKR